MMTRNRWTAADRAYLASLQDWREALTQWPGQRSRAAIYREWRRLRAGPPPVPKPWPVATVDKQLFLQLLMTWAVLQTSSDTEPLDIGAVLQRLRDDGDWRTLASARPQNARPPHRLRSTS